MSVGKPRTRVTHIEPVWLGGRVFRERSAGRGFESLSPRCPTIGTRRNQAVYRAPPGHGKSWNLGRPFSRPGKSWKITKVMESHGNDDNVMEFLLLH